MNLKPTANQARARSACSRGSNNSLHPSTKAFELARSQVSEIIDAEASGERCHTRNTAMKTYHLKFLAWVFSAFLPPDDPNAQNEVEDYYALLDVAKNAKADDIKKAYRKKSLLLHPDKLRQRGMKYEGQIITEDEARARFQQMKAAYDTLSDPKRRQLYDALGHKGMDFVQNPSHAWDPHVLLGNLAKSSLLDRAKLITLVLLFFGLVLLQPILLCAKVDQMLAQNGGSLENASWIALCIPFWLFALFYGVLLIIGKALFPLLQWIAFVAGVLFLTMKFDNVLPWKYSLVFIPFYFWMFFRAYEARKQMAKANADMEKMATIEYIEKYVINEKRQDEEGNDIEAQQMHRTYNDLSTEEKDKINEEYIIVHVPPKASVPGETESEEHDMNDELERIERSPEYQEAVARYEDAYKSITRIIVPEIPLLVLVIVQLDMGKGWNWGLTFLPLWIALFMEFCGGCYGFCCTAHLAHIEVQEEMAEHFEKQKEAKEAQKEAEKAQKGEKNQDEGNGNEKKESEKEAVGDASTKTGEVITDNIGSEDSKAEIDNSVTAEPVTEAHWTDEAIEADVSGMGLKAIREELESYGISTKTFVEKSEFVAALVKARKEGKTPIEKKSEDTLNEANNEDENDYEHYFEMDEDTFNYYQQAEQEAETKAVEAQSKACASCCSIIFKTIIAVLFVVKLNRAYADENEIVVDGGSSYSSFWILFPIFLVAGVTVCCFFVLICCGRDIDKAMSDESGDGANEDSNETDGESPPADSVDTGVPITPMPPPTQTEAATDESVEKKTSQESTPAAAAAAPTQPEEKTVEEATTEDSDDMHDLD
jgi:DnaJ-domain-containing protein 1